MCAEYMLVRTLNVSQQTVASWEVGRRGVPAAPLRGLADALSVSIESLIGEKPPEQARPRTQICRVDRD